MYDLYGNHAGAYEGSHLEGPINDAEQDYIRWLYDNPDIAKEIDDMIMDKIHEADIKRKDKAETSIFESTLRNKIQDRHTIENQMAYGLFKDQAKERSSDIGVLIQNQLIDLYNDHATEFVAELTLLNTKSHIEVFSQYRSIFRQEKGWQSIVSSSKRSNIIT